MSTPVPVIAGIASGSIHTPRLNPGHTPVLNPGHTPVSLPKVTTPVVSKEVTSATIPTATLQAVLQQLRNQTNTTVQSGGDQAASTKTGKSNTVSSTTQKQTNQSQEVLREQLKALIKSGQIKIRKLFLYVKSSSVTMYCDWQIYFLYVCSMLFVSN